MTRYSIKGHVSGRGTVQHIIKAGSKDAAWAKFCAVYPDRTCQREKSVTLPRLVVPSISPAVKRRAAKAKRYQALADYGLSHSQAAKSVGANRTTFANFCERNDVGPFADGRAMNGKSSNG